MKNNTTSNTQKLDEKTRLLNSVSFVSSENTHTTPFLTLPDDTLIRIMLLLPPVDFTKLSATCRKFQNLSQSYTLWQTLKVELLKNIAREQNPSRNQLYPFKFQLKKFYFLKNNNTVKATPRECGTLYAGIMGGIAFITIGIWILAKDQSAVGISFGVFSLALGILMLGTVLTSLASAYYETHKRNLYLNNRIHFFSNHIRICKNELKIKKQKMPDIIIDAANLADVNQISP